MKEISLFYYNFFLISENENIKCSRVGLVEVKRKSIKINSDSDTIILLRIGKIT
jgi:hypothetical protein